MQNFKTVAYLLLGYFWLVGLGGEGDLVESNNRSKLNKTLGGPWLYQPMLVLGVDLDFLHQ